MARVILKYPFREIIPTGHNPKVLKIAEQYGVIQVWVEVDEYTEGQSTLALRMVATGQDFNPTNCVYLDTVLASTGFVWHFYRVIAQ